MYNYPDDTGHFGIYGGRFASETLIPALDELKDAYHNIVPTKAFSTAPIEEVACSESSSE